MDCFGDEYSEIYDLIYHDKDYRVECDFIEAIFQRWSDKPIQSMLDFGCGTGNHAVEMAARGLKVTGVDRSMNMLASALRKATHRLSDPTQRPEWRIELPSEGKWDSAISMFETINYLEGKKEFAQLLRRLNELLVPGGLALIETWNGAAVPFLFEAIREKKFSARGQEITRRTEAKVDWRNQVMDVQFTFFQNGETEPRIAELHHLHYYTPIEVAELGESAGLKLRDIYPSYQMRRPELNDFSVVCVLQKI